MPVLRLIKERFKKERPLKGLRVSACLHVTTETAGLMLTLQAGGGMELELAARSPGLPELRGVVVPDRPYDVVPMQYGDVTIIRRRIKF